MNNLAVITGASKGIGREAARLFAKKGFDLALCSRSMSDLEKLKEELLSSAGGDAQKILIQRCDVSKKDQVEKFGAAILKEFRHVDVLVNNAGIYLPGEVYNEPVGTLETLIETNLYSAYHLSRALVPAMIKRKSGHVFNLCSVASINAYPNGGSYSISKFALLGFSKALREELKPHHIKVTSLLPGATLTDSWAGTTLPDDRFMKASDVAQTIWDIYSLSDTTVVEEVILRPVLGDL